MLAFYVYLGAKLRTLWHPRFAWNTGSHKNQATCIHFFRGQQEATGLGGFKLKLTTTDNLQLFPGILYKKIPPKKIESPKDLSRKPRCQFHHAITTIQSPHGCFQKYGYPQTIHLFIGFSITNHPFLEETPLFLETPTSNPSNRHIQQLQNGQRSMNAISGQMVRCCFVLPRSLDVHRFQGNDWSHGFTETNVAFLYRNQMVG